MNPGEPSTGRSTTTRPPFAGVPRLQASRQAPLPSLRSMQPASSRLPAAIAIEAAAILALCACATAQLHSENELNQVALTCGLSEGDVVQETEEKRLLFLYRVAPKPQQRHCVYQWAHRNHLTLVTINAVNEGPGPQS